MKYNYRYILEPYKGRKTRFTCPQCGKPYSFTRYIDQTTGERLPKHVGICNHVNSCGYRFTAGEYLRKTNHERLLTNPVKIFKKETPKPISYIPPAIFYPTIYSDNVEQNCFFQFMSKLIGKEHVQGLFWRYNVGNYHQWSNATVFWQVDTEEKVRTGKIMHFDPNSGKRIHGKQNWIHSLKMGSDFNLKQCLFGEHLITKNLISNKSIGLVESEKTAVIASCFANELIWLATGGLNLFNPGTNPEKFKILKGRTVIIYPDLGIKRPNRETPFEEWTRKAELLQHIGVNCMVSDFLEKRATEESRIRGEDIADYLIRDHINKGKKHIRAQP